MGVSDAYLKDYDALTLITDNDTKLIISALLDTISVVAVTCWLCPLLLLLLLEFYNVGVQIRFLSCKIEDNSQHHHDNLQQFYHNTLSNLIGSEKVSKGEQHRKQSMEKGLEGEDNCTDKLL